MTTYGQIFIARGEDASWTAVSGKYYDPAALAHYAQIGDKVVIMNGVDNLSYLNIATATVIPFTTLSNPSTPTIANNGTDDLTTTATFTIYYAVTANSTVGETAASTSASQTVKLDRDLWNPSTNSLKVTWSAVTSAQSYNVYMAITAPGAAPALYLIASGINGLQFIDDGSLAQDPTRPAPTVNSTAGPKTSRGEVINGRLFMTGDKDNPYYVRYGGDFGYELDFSPANGGGFTPVGNGTKELPIKVKAFRDAKGTPQITVLCQGTNGRGKRYLLTPDTLTFGDTVISFFDVTEDSGQDGTDSPDGVVLYNNNLWYPSRDGFKTTGTKPQLQNVLSTDRVSNTIQPDMKALNNGAMDGCVGLGFEGRIYWALPAGSEMNNEIWVLDLDRKGAWMKPWSLQADWLLLYNDNSGSTHFLVVRNSQLYEFSTAAFSSDDGTAFATNAHSGEIYFSKDKRMWAKLLQVIFVISRPVGTMHFNIQGKTEDSPLIALGSPTEYDSTLLSGVAGWGEPGQLKGFGSRRWSAIGTPPSVNADGSQEVAIEVDEECQWFSYEWLSSTAGTDYALNDVIAEYIEVGIRDLS